MRYVGKSVTLVLLAATGVATFSGWAAPEPADEDTLRSEFVNRLTREFQVEPAAGPEAKHRLDRTEKSILQWSWPRNGFTDGQTYAWGSKGRPHVIGGAFLIPSEQVAYYEFVSISPVPLSCMREGQVVWTPPAVNLAWQKVADAPDVAATPRSRLIQLRAISQQFHGVEHLGPPRYEDGTRWELRLLTTPIHRYSDADQGVVDGAIFALVMGTDPQLLLLLEAQQKEGQAAWMAAFARLSGFELTALHGEKEVWKSPKVEDGHARDSAWHLSKPLEASKLFPKVSK